MHTEYVPAEASFNLFSGANWIQLLKYWGVAIVVSIVVSVVIYLIIKLVVFSSASNIADSDDKVQAIVHNGMGSVLMILIPVVAVVFMGQMYTISWFESWDGCYKKVEK